MSIPIIIVLFTGPLSVDKHLKMVREATWDARSKWRDIGLELGIDVSTLEDCFLYIHRQLDVIIAIRLVTVSLVFWSSGLPKLNLPRH